MQISDRVPRGRVYRSLAVASAILIALSVVGMVSWSLWGDESTGAPSAVICALTFVLGVLGTVLVGNASRRATVSDTNPTAYVINLASLPASGADMRALGRAFGVTVRMLWNYNMTLAVDPQDARFYRGMIRPKIVLRVPAKSLVRVGTNSGLTPAGTPAIERVEIEFQTNEGLKVVQFAFAENGVLHNQVLAVNLEKLRLVAGLSGENKSGA